MTTFLIAWALVMVAACFVLTAVVVVAEVLKHRRTHAARPVTAPRVPAQRAPSAAAVVRVHDLTAFDEFLRELILTTHVEDVLS